MTCSIHDPSLCVYIGNISSIDEQSLINYCAKFGTILSCSIANCPDEQRSFCDFRFVEFTTKQDFDTFLNFPQHGIDSIKLDVKTYANLLKNFELLNIDRKLFVGPIMYQKDIKTVTQFYKTIDPSLCHCLSRQTDDVYILIEFSSRQYLRTIIQQQTIPKTIDNQIFTIHPAVHPKDYIPVTGKLRICGLTEKISEEILLEYFNKRAHVLTCHIVPDDPRCAIIELDDANTVDKLLETPKLRLHGANLLLNKFQNDLHSTLSNNDGQFSEPTSPATSECSWTSPPRVVVNQCPLSKSVVTTMDVADEIDVKPAKGLFERFANEFEQIRNEYTKKFNQDRILIEQELNRIVNEERIIVEKFEYSRM
ncbi:unnamed protein product [Adineta ricciae]|uniref:RRM domain-containing protein n=1 Tax=Adineta ricciae TaxID=249248 RepID=A0A814GM81_ADIRI|nr:unnamed protein product [Adineta ricciae]